MAGKISEMLSRIRIRTKMATRITIMIKKLPLSLLPQEEKRSNILPLIMIMVMVMMMMIIMTMMTMMMNF